MNPNVFYYQTDAFENQEENKNSQTQNMEEQIEYFLSDQFSSDEKKIKISEIVTNLEKQLKKAVSERDQWKDKYEKQTKKFRKLQNFSKEKFDDVSLTRSFTRHKSPKKQFHSNISIKKSPISKKTFDLNFDQQKQRNVVSTRKSLKPSRSMKSNSVNISINKKLEKETNQLQKYKKFVCSIGKIILQFKPKDFDKQSSQSLQEIWKWLKQHFEEYIDLKMKIIKLEKNNNNNTGSQSKLKKLFKGMTEDEAVKQIKSLKQNLKILEQIFQKSQSYLGYKNSKKTMKNYQKFDKFLDKHLKAIKQLIIY